MDDALLIHRLHFGFTNTFHYLFPQLTMGLAPLIVVLKTLALRLTDPIYNSAARFWAKIFGINFVFGVVTGIPMEFQFGTNWAQFSRVTGGVIGQPLVMEGVFSFFLESAFLGLFLYGEKRLSPIQHWFAALAVFIGSWLSGFFIIVTNAWMQHPVAFERAATGEFHVNSFWALLLNPWAQVQYAHNMFGALATGAFAVAATGAFYKIENKFAAHARTFLTTGVLGTLLAIVVIPTGDLQGRLVAKHQPTSMAAMEGLFQTEAGAPIVILGQPDSERLRIDNPLPANNVLSFLLYGNTSAEVRGLNEFPRSDWPTNIPLLYYAYHVMAGLGTIFLGVTLVATFLLWRGTLHTTTWMHWILLLCLPLPFIANTAGWLTAELGRQPWVVYGLMRTADGYSTNVHAGNGLFTLIGFMGLYALLAILYFFLMFRAISRGPESIVPHDIHTGDTASAL